MRIAINGFGRIGRSVFRILEERDDIEVVAINDLFDYEARRYLLSYDTVMGPFAKPLRLEDHHLVTEKGRAIRRICRGPSSASTRSSRRPGYSVGASSCSNIWRRVPGGLC